MSPLGTTTVARSLMRSRTSIGIDFGTTNTVVAVATLGEPVRAVTFQEDREQSDYLPVRVVLRAIGSKSVRRRSFRRHEGD
jgi:molecular chaperone DnaK (HSP70)